MFTIDGQPYFYIDFMVWGLCITSFIYCVFSYMLDKAEKAKREAPLIKAGAIASLCFSIANLCWVVFYIAYEYWRHYA